jgi:hypothetical protein
MGSLKRPTSTPELHSIPVPTDNMLELIRAIHQRSASLNLIRIVSIQAETGHISKNFLSLAIAAAERPSSRPE